MTQRRRVSFGRVRVVAAIAGLFTVVAIAGAGTASADNTGSLSTYDATCSGTQQNFFAEKTDVYIAGSNFDADVPLYVKVTEPDDTPLTKFVDVDGDTIQTDANGDLPCTQLYYVVHKYLSFVDEVGFDDTTNGGTVYKVWVSPDANFALQKTNTFKVTVDGEVVVPAAAPTVSKTAEESFDRTTAWDLNKSVDKTLVQQVGGGNATFNYTIAATHSDTDGNWQVDGVITVTNPNAAAITVSLTDAIDNGGVCTVTNGVDVVVPAGPGGIATRSYNCTYTATTTPAAGTNTVTATWAAQVLADGTLLSAGSQTGDAPVDFATADPNLIDDCITVTDTFDGTAGASSQICSNSPSPTTSMYSRQIAVPMHGCLTHTNTVSFVTSTSGTGDPTTADDSVTVTVCGPAVTSALTIGFWKNTNGNSLIQNYCTPTAKTSLATYLSGLGAGSGPFADAAGKTCSQLVTYVNNIIKAASATNMNNMLKAQMLATALDVYFSSSTMGYTNTTVNKAKPPSNFLLSGSLGGFNMDVTAICPMVDNTTAGTATCKNNLPSTNAYASGALPNPAMTVQAILTYASTTPSPFNGSPTNSIWYGTDRTKQEILKNVFDQINNQDAFSA